MQESQIQVKHIKGELDTHSSAGLLNIVTNGWMIDSFMSV